MEATAELKGMPVKLEPVLIVRKALIFAVEQEFATKRVGTLTDPIEMYKGEQRRYCPGMRNGAVLRGIPLEDERRIPAFSNLLGVSPESVNFEERVKNYWQDYLYSIPYASIVGSKNRTELKVDGGKEIDASFKEVDGKLYPNNIEEYILYNLLIMENTDKVARSPEFYDSPGRASFFCVDLEQEEKRKVNIAENNRLIRVELARLDTNEDNLDDLRYMVSLFSTEVSAIEAMRFSKSEAMEALAEYSRVEPVKFLEVIKDKHLSEKSLIRQLVQASFLVDVSGTYMLNDEPLGDLKKTVLMFKNPTFNLKREELKNKLNAYKAIMVV